jgi:hypothetical protein
MLNRILSGALLALVSFAACDRAAVAATIDTFDFSDSTSWDLGVTFTGSFTGQVEPSGLIEQADLSNFTASLIGVALNLRGPGEGPASADLAGVRLFSYDPTGGPSSFDLILAMELTGETGLVCVGAVTTFSPSCNPDGFHEFLADIVLPEGVTDFASGLPTITLVSSRSTAPEAPTWAMLLAGFAGLGFVGHRARRWSAVTAPGARAR